MALNILADDEEWFNIPHVVRIALRSIAENQQHTAKIVSDSNAAVQKMSKHVAALENKIRSMEADQLATKLATSLNRPAPHADHSNNNAAIVAAAFPRASDIVTISGEPMKALNKKIASLTTSVADIQQRVSNHERKLKSAVESFATVSDQQDEKFKSTDSIIKRLVEEVRTCEARLDKNEQLTHRELRQRLGNVETSLSQLRSSSKSFQALEVEAVKKANARVDSFVRSQSEQIQQLTENVRKLEEANATKSGTVDQNDYEVHHGGRVSKDSITGGHYRNSSHITTTSSSLQQRSPTPSRPSQPLHMSPNPYAPPPAVTIEDWTRFNSTVSDLRTALGTLKNDIASRSTDVNDQLKELLIRYESLKQEQFVMKDTVQKVGDSSESVRLQLKAAVRKLAKESNEKIKLIVREEITTVVETKSAAVPKTSSQPQEDIEEQRREAKLVAAVEQKIKDGVISSLAESFDGLRKDVEKYMRRMIDLEHSNMKIKSNLVKESESTKRHIERIDETLSRSRPQSPHTTEVLERLKANLFSEQQANLANYESQMRRLVARINETESQLELLRDGVRQRIDLISKEFDGKLSITGDKVFEAAARMDSLTAACLKQYDELQSSVNSAGVQAKEMAGKIAANFEVRYDEILSIIEAITGGTAEFLHSDNLSVLRKSTAGRAAQQSSYSRKSPNNEGYQSVKFASQRTDSAGGAHRSTSVAESIYTEGEDDTDNERAGRGEESDRLTKNARAAKERPPPAAVPKTLLSLAQALTESRELIHSIRADVDDIKIKTVPSLQNEISALGMLTSKCTESMTLLANDFDKSLQKHSRERTEDLRFVDMLESRMGKCEVDVKNLALSSVSSDATSTCQIHSSASRPPLRFADTDSQATMSPSRFSNDTNKAQNPISDSHYPLCEASRVAANGTSANVDTSPSLRKLTETFASDLLELRAKQKGMSDLHSQNLESLRSELSDKMVSVDARLSNEIANLTTKIHHTDAAASAANDLFRQQQQQYALLSSRMENMRNENMLFSSNTSSPSGRHQNPSALNISTADLSSAVADEVKRELENLFYTRDEVDSILLSQMMTFVGRLNQKADA